MLSWMIGKTVFGVSTSNFDGAEATNVTIMFDDGSEISFSENWVDYPGWSRITVSQDDKSSNERS